jgi:2-methylcitrate dehydratase PrpD
MTLTEELAEWASRIRLNDVPGEVVGLAKTQILSQLAAIRAGAAHPLGLKLMRGFGPPLQPDSGRSAFVLAGLGAWLHFDDTAYAGHLSNSTVTVPLAVAHARGLDGADLLTAVIAANECAARVTAATTLGPFRGQSATFTHVTGAIAGRLRGEDAPAGRWVDAFGLGFGLPPRTVPVGFLGGDAKVFSAATPVRVGLDACDATRAGLSGSADILEHREGFLSRFATTPLPEAVLAGLGRRWHTQTLSFKVHPGGPGVDAAVDCCLDLHKELGTLRPQDVAEIVVDTSLYTLLVDRRSAAYLRGPDSPVSALVFSVPYTVATTLLTGHLTVADFTSEQTTDPDRWALAAKVRVEHDEEMTRDSFRCEVPFGEALRQAGPRGAAWLREFGSYWPGSDGQWLVDLVGDPDPPSPDFAAARKVTGARVTVRLTTGGEVVREVRIPVGAVGAVGGPPVSELVRDKFLGTGGPAEVVDVMAGLEKATADDVAEALRAALGDVAPGR